MLDSESHAYTLFFFVKYNCDYAFALNAVMLHHYSILVNNFRSQNNRFLLYLNLCYFTFLFDF